MKWKKFRKNILVITYPKIGNLWANIEKSGFSTENKMTYRWNIRIFQSAFNTPQKTLIFKCETFSEEYLRVWPSIPHSYCKSAFRYSMPSQRSTVIKVFVRSTPHCSPPSPRKNNKSLHWLGILLTIVGDWNRFTSLT